jgi:hypothetical protein
LRIYRISAFATWPCGYIPYLKQNLHALDARRTHASTADLFACDKAKQQRNLPLNFEWLDWSTAIGILATAHSHARSFVQAPSVGAAPGAALLPWSYEIITNKNNNKS